jgi:hypothetical protein
VTLHANAGVNRLSVCHKIAQQLAHSLRKEQKTMAYWLMKSEPDEFSIKDLAKLSKARWDGVRNYQARNFLRSMAVGDEFFFYHSSCPEPGIAGIGKII